MDLLLLKTRYGIKDKDIEKRALVDSENGRRTALKEMIGEKYIIQNNVFKDFVENELHREYNGYKKVTSVKMQRAGVDYIVYAGDEELYVDLKSLVGPSYEKIPLELTQNNIWTNTTSKMTDYHLYVVHDDYHHTRKWVPYADIVKECKKHKPALIYSDDRTSCRFEWGSDVYTSNNGSGRYILWGEI